LNALISNMRGMLQRLIGEHIELKINLGSHVCRIRADRGQIEQVVLNLVVNARDAMPEGGRLMIATSQTTFASSESSSQLTLAAGLYSVLSVTDTGVGMDARTQRRIFEPFFTTKADGTGLGLSTVHDIVKRSGGGIVVESKPRGGTTFRVFLPCTNERDPGPSKRPELSIEPAEKGTVIVIEDDECVRKVTCDVFSREGFDVLEAKNAYDGFRLYLNYAGTVDLVVIDMILPDAHGRDLGDRIAFLKRRTALLY